jgi:hypothetical protein
MRSIRRRLTSLGSGLTVTALFFVALSQHGQKWM